MGGASSPFFGLGSGLAVRFFILIWIPGNFGFFPGSGYFWIQSSNTNTCGSDLVPITSVTAIVLLGERVSLRIPIFTSIFGTSWPSGITE